VYGSNMTNRVREVLFVLWVRDCVLCSCVSVAQILQRTSLDKDMAVTRSVTDAVNKIRAQVQAQTAETSIDAASIAVGVSSAVE
jgi:hypothetical protein